MGPFTFHRHARTGGHERSADEKALVRRLDTFLLTFGCISQGELADSPETALARLT